MSITGKNTKSIRKVSVEGSKLAQSGYRKLMFQHEAALGDTTIDLTGLSAPSDATSKGFVNPSSSELATLKLLTYKANITLVSSLRGLLIPYVSYQVQGNSLLKLSFDAEENEIFTGIIDSVPINMTLPVSGRQIIKSGTLADTTTDFNIGEPIEIEDNDAQLDQLIVFRNGLQQFRNTDNSSSVEDGNYYLINSGDGTGTVIRFNEAADGDDSIAVFSTGFYAWRPQVGQQALLEQLSGKIDGIVPYVALLAGVSEASIASAATYPDLKAFGDRVVELERKRKIQTKYLASGHSTNGTEITGISFNNLVIGQRYRLSGQLSMDISNSDPFAGMQILNGSDAVALPGNGEFGSNTVGFRCGINTVFVATATTIKSYPTSMNAPGQVRGDGTKSETFLQLEEIDDLEETTDFT